MQVYQPESHPKQTLQYTQKQRLGRVTLTRNLVSRLAHTHTHTVHFYAQKKGECEYMCTCACLLYVTRHHTFISLLHAPIPNYGEPQECVRRCRRRMFYAAAPSGKVCMLTVTHTQKPQPKVLLGCEEKRDRSKKATTKTTTQQQQQQQQSLESVERKFDQVLVTWAKFFFAMPCR